MPRAGRPLEEFVRELERLLIDQPVEIRSPDFVMGKHSGIRRELDVGIRESGSDRILVMIECRDRQNTQDVGWMDCLVGKRDDVDVERVVAVSPSGFSPGARSIARVKGIELRTFQEVNLETIKDWISLREMVVRMRHAQVSGVRVIVREEASLSAADREHLLRVPITLDAPLFVFKRNGSKASVNEIWKETAKFGPFDHIPPGETRQGTLTVNYPDAENSYVLEAAGQQFEVEQIQIAGKFSYTDGSVPIGRSYTYANEGGVLTQNSEVQVEHEGVEFTFGVHRSADGSRMSITRRLSPEDVDRVIHYDIEAVFTLTEQPDQ